MISRSRALLACLILLGAGLAAYNPFSIMARDHATSVTVAAGSFYGVLRTANSVMSVIRDVDVEGSAVVASVTTSPGQALEPVIDTIDRTSSLLFGLMIAAGILSVLALPTGLVGGLMVAGGGSVLLILSLARVLPGPFLVAIRAIATNAIRIGVFLGLIVPISFSLSGWLGERLTEQAYAEASAIFERVGSASETAQDEPERETGSTDEAADTGLDQQTGPTSETPSGEVTEDDAGLMDSARRGLASVYGTTSRAVGGALASTRDFANAVPDFLVDNTMAIPEWVSIGVDLFQATVSIAVAYVLRLLVLPVLIMAAILYLVRVRLTPAAAPAAVEGPAAIPATEGQVPGGRRGP